MTHLGSGIWSYTFLRAGAILLVTVPATIMTSACRGLALNTTPNRSISYLGAAKCIISTAQHAKPKVIGHNELRRPQFTISSIFASTNSVAASILPWGLAAVAAVFFCWTMGSRLWLLNCSGISARLTSVWLFRTKRDEVAILDLCATFLTSFAEQKQNITQKNTN